MLSDLKIGEINATLKSCGKKLVDRNRLNILVRLQVITPVKSLDDILSWPVALD